jgi:prepilin-type N-terminal cleavage/methylation domain-containing protein
MYLKNNKGFTIIELIVVIAVISLLASIVLTNVNGFMAKARDAKRKGDIHQLVVAFNLVAGAAGSFPSVGGTACIGLGAANSCMSGLQDNLHGNDLLQTQLKTVMSSPPLDPLPNRTWNAYAYTDGLVCPGCQMPCPNGNYILWMPDSGTASDADCKGVGVPACCWGSSNGCTNTGYFCAVKLN